MKFEEWKKLMVHTDDLRTMNIDCFTDIGQRVPGVGFMKPVLGTFAGHPVIERFDCLGFITRDDKRGRWDVLIENTEREFIYLEDAARYLWDNHYKDQLDVTRFLLIGVDREGEIVLNKKCVSEEHMLETAANELPESDNPGYDKANLEADLSKPGARFHEFIGGHFAAFLLEDE